MIGTILAAVLFSAVASPEDFSTYVKSEADAFVRLAREAGIRAE